MVKNDENKVQTYVIVCWDHIFNNSIVKVLDGNNENEAKEEFFNFYKKFFSINIDLSDIKIFDTGVRDLDAGSFSLPNEVWDYEKTLKKKYKN